MKKSLLLAGLLLTTTGAFAAENTDAGKWFIGIGMTNGSGTTSVTDSGRYSYYNYPYTSGVYGSSTDYDYDSDSIPLTLGFITSSNNRAKISVQTINAKTSDGSKNKLEGIDFDFDWTFDSAKDSKITPYIGLGLGSYSVKDSAQYFVDNEDLKGVSVNFNAGILYNVDKNLEFELGYKHKTITWQDVTYNSYCLVNNRTSHCSGKLEGEEQLNSLYIGANYKF